MPSRDDSRSDLQSTRWPGPADGADCFNRDDVRAFTEAASFLIGLHNDLFSHPKEHLDAVADVNLLDAVLQEHRCSLEEAVVRLIELSNQITVRVVQLRDQFLTHADKDLATYVHATIEMVAGHLEFERRCIRYQRGAVELPRIALTVQPPRNAVTGPPVVPTLAWWWSAR